MIVFVKALFLTQNRIEMVHVLFPRTHYFVSWRRLNPTSMLPPPPDLLAHAALTKQMVHFLVRQKAKFRKKDCPSKLSFTEIQMHDQLLEVQQEETEYCGTNMSQPWHGLVGSYESEFVSQVLLRHVNYTLKHWGRTTRWWLLVQGCFHLPRRQSAKMGFVEEPFLCAISILLP